MSTTAQGKSGPANTASPGQAVSKDWKNTLFYVGGAVAFLALTGVVEFFNHPAPIKDYGKVGLEFYKDFVDPTKATSLEVFAFDAKSVQPIDFRVQRLENGRWVIPSHHDYPADAEERLGKTAASIIGITRGAMVTRWPADHARYGVVNPKQDSLTVDEVEGVGRRIRLGGEKGTVLADYIIGKKVEGDEDQYYVRAPEEDEVYITKLDIDLSTKFTDWIETKMFEFSNGEVLRLTSNDYSFDEVNGQITESAVTSLARDKAWSDDWKLDSLDEATEALNKDAIRDTVGAVADLEVIGVRPKQKGLTPDLQLDRNEIRSQQAVDLLQQDLLARGFLLQPGENQSLHLISREGELFAGTEDGLRYRMYFGRVFTGSQEELEIGLTSNNNDQAKDAAATDTAAEKAEGETSTSDRKPGRYLFVRVEFDKTLLGEEPSEPTEPQKSAALLEAEKEATEDQASKDDNEEADKEAKTEGDAEQPTELEKLQKEFEDAQSAHKEALRAYEDFQEKVKKGLEKADELNRRFADWYYVIPGESFDKLKLRRADLVQPKEAEAEAAADGDALSLPEGLGFPPAGDPSAPAAEEAVAPASDEADSSVSDPGAAENGNDAAADESELGPDTDETIETTDSTDAGAAADGEPASDPSP